MERLTRGEITIGSIAALVFIFAANPVVQFVAAGAFLGAGFNHVRRAQKKGVISTFRLD